MGRCRSCRSQNCGGAKGVSEARAQVSTGGREEIASWEDGFRMPKRKEKKGFCGCERWSWFDPDRGECLLDLADPNPEREYVASLSCLHGLGIGVKSAHQSISSIYVLFRSRREVRDKGLPGTM